MTLIFLGRMAPMPGEQGSDPLLLIFAGAAIDLAGIAKQEIEGGAGNGGLARGGLELVVLRLAAIVAYRLLEIGKVVIRGVRSKAVAPRLAGEEMVQVTTHRFLLGEPGLRHDMLAIVGKRRFERVDRRFERHAAGRPHQPLGDPRPFYLDAKIRFDQLARIESLVRINA